MCARPFLIVSLLAVVSFSNPAHALDKRLRLLFKTSGYGAASGFLVGAGTYAIGMGDWKNMLMGASAGLYAGIALAAYVVFTQDDYVAEKHRRSKSPYAPRKPVHEDDWQDEGSGDEEDLYEQLPPEASSGSGLQGLSRRAEVVLWAPLVSVEF